MRIRGRSRGGRTEEGGAGRRTRAPALRFSENFKVFQALTCSRILGRRLDKMKPQNEKSWAIFEMWNFQVHFDEVLSLCDDPGIFLSSKSAGSPRPGEVACKQEGAGPTGWVLVKFRPFCISLESYRVLAGGATKHQA